MCDEQSERDTHSLEQRLHSDALFTASWFWKAPREPGRPQLDKQLYTSKAEGMTNSEKAKAMGQANDLGWRIHLSDRDSEPLCTLIHIPGSRCSTDNRIAHCTAALYSSRTWQPIVQTRDGETDLPVSPRRVTGDHETRVTRMFENMAVSIDGRQMLYEARLVDCAARRHRHMRLARSGLRPIA